MKISQIRIYKLSIPMVPFRIATGTMYHAQNLFIRLETDSGLTGVGECSAFPVITGETQSTCFAMATELAALWKNKVALDLVERLQELDDFTAFNSTVKSAFDMALYDLSAKDAGLPLYEFLKGRKKPMETDLTIGLDEPERMADKAMEFQRKGVRMIKIKLGKDGKTDILRVQKIRNAIGPSIRLRVDANQGWDYESAGEILQKISTFDIEFCEQPLRQWNDILLPSLRKNSPVKIMADESVFNHHDAERLIQAGACDYINIKLAKSGGIREAIKIDEVCAAAGIPCMMGGMLESRMALTAFAHFALSRENIIFYDMDTCLLGHTLDPVVGGLSYRGYFIEVPDSPGIGADIDENFLKTCEQTII